MIEFHAAIFARIRGSFGPPSRALATYHLERSGVPLHDVVRVNFNKVETTDILHAQPVVEWRTAESEVSGSNPRAPF